MLSISIQPVLSNYITDPIPDLQKLISACFGEHFNQSSFNSCSTYDELTRRQQKIDFQAIVTSINHMKTSQIDHWHACSSEEIHTFLCNRSKRATTISCERKKLRHAFKIVGEKNYSRLVQTKKKDLLTSIYKIKKMFVGQIHFSAASSLTVPKLEYIFFIFLFLNLNCIISFLFI